MPVDSSAYASGFFELSIDGHDKTMYLKSVEGGFAKGSLIDESIGPDNARVKHLGPVEIDPISFEYSAAGSRHVIEWISDSWAKKFVARDGQITHGNFKGKATFEHHFYRALITEASFPTLDGSSKDASYLKVKFQPESIETKSLPGTTDLVATGPGVATKKHKQWSPSAFRLTIQGVDGLEYVNKIDGFTVKQGVKKFFTGVGRLPEIEPTKIEFPNITGTIGLDKAGPLLDWYNSYVVKGKRDTKWQRHGTLEFLSTDRKSTMFAIGLNECGILHCEVESSKANAESIKRVKFELYVGSMEMMIQHGD